MRVLMAVAVAVLAIPCAAEQLKPETSRAFDRYLELAEKQMADGPFLAATPKGAGTFVAERRLAGVTIPDGQAHDWLGVLFIPGATIASVRAIMQDYDAYKTVYKPDVTDSKLLGRDGDRFRVFLRLYKHEFLTLVYDSEYDVRYSYPREGRMEIVSRSTKITQQGDDHGFLWRLNSYWRFEQADGGVYAQCRAISLSRGIPFGFGWLRGFLQKFPRESMVSTLEATRRAAGK